MATPIDTRQPSLALSETLATSGVFPSRDSYNDGMTLGMFHTYAFTLVQAGAPLANGQILNINQNTALFSLLGANYGGDGQTTFALPDLDGRSAVSDGQGPGLSNLALGQQTGAASVLLSQAQLPASVGGTSAAAGEDQPQLAIKYLIRAEGIYPSPGGGGAGRLDLIGSVVKFAGNFVPEGYFECNGQLLDIATYDALFSLIGTAYGGDGQATFAVPDLRGRHIAGAGGNYVLGETFGQEDVFIGQANLPVEMGGSGIPIDNREPSLALNYGIALGGIFPSQNGEPDPYDAMIGEVMAFAGDFVPRGFALCAGQLLPINQNQALFSLLGTTYGGDGRVTFALPDLRGRSVVGTGDLPAGSVIGSDTFDLGLDHIPGLSYSGSAAGDMLYGANEIDAINGLGGDDQIRGWGGNDALIGGSGRDFLAGGDGNDQLTGGAENDRLYGNSGADRLTGGGGADQLWGGGNGDRFAFLSATSGNDIVNDFSSAQGDRLVIDASGFGGGLAAGALAANRLVVNGAANQAFGQFLYNTATGQLSFDADGTGVATAVNTVRLFNGGVAAAL